MRIVLNVLSLTGWLVTVHRLWWVKSTQLLKGSSYSHRIKFMTWYDVMWVSIYFVRCFDVIVVTDATGRVTVGNADGVFEYWMYVSHK